MMLDLLAIAVGVFLLAHGVLSIRSGLKKEQKQFGISFPLAGIFKSNIYISNIITGVMEVIAAIAILIIYVSDFF